MSDPSKYTDDQYIRYDPFEGDMDTDVRCRSVKLLNVRKESRCVGNGVTKPHQIPKGTRVRSERGIVDGEWHRCITCLNCIAHEFEEFHQ